MRLSAIGGAVVALAAACTLAIGVGQAAAAALPGHLAGFRTYFAPSSAATTFTVPSTDCSPVPSGGFQAVALGAELFRPQSAGQSNSTAMFVITLCTGPGPATYESIAQINGTQQFPSLTIQPGDSVTTSAVENASGSTLTISDASDNGGAPDTVTGAGGTPLWAGVGAIAGNCSSPFSACSPVPTITPVSFSASTLNGKSLLGALALPSNVTSQAGAVEISTKATGLKSFTDTWVSSCGVGPGIC